MSTITQNSVVEIQNFVIIHESWPIKPNPGIIEIFFFFFCPHFVSEINPTGLKIVKLVPNFSQSLEITVVSNFSVMST